LGRNWCQFVYFAHRKCRVSATRKSILFSSAVRHDVHEHYVHHINQGIIESVEAIGATGASVLVYSLAVTAVSHSDPSTHPLHFPVVAQNFPFVDFASHYLRLPLIMRGTH
jgi:hypothetical protein